MIYHPCMKHSLKSLEYMQARLKYHHKAITKAEYIGILRKIITYYRGD